MILDMRELSSAIVDHQTYRHIHQNLVCDNCKGH